MLGAKRLIRTLSVAIAIYYGVVVVAGLLARPEAADIAVVLGNEVLKDGLLSNRLAARVDCALALYREKKASLIMVSGGKGVSGFDEAGSMAGYLMKKGVPASDIIIDSQGVNTSATAVNAAKIMQERHFVSAVIVTQYFHIPRTELAFHTAGIRQFSAAYPAYYELRDIPSTLREMIAIPVYWLHSYHSGLF